VAVAETVVDYNGYSRTLSGMGLAWCAVLLFAQIVEQARQLAWQKQFAAAEKLYRQALMADPESRDARFGLAQVLLWEGRFSEARRLFKTLDGGDAVEGAATAAYWQGDFRTAAREFASMPDREFARRSLADIRTASAGDVRAAIEGIDDNQPYRAWRSSATASTFSDPLTRWDVSAGGYGLHNIGRAIARTEPFISVTNALVLPWQRLTITTTAGALKFPDATTRPIGGVSVSRKLSSNASMTIAAQHRELLTNATAIDTHPSVTTLSAAWSRYVAHGWIAGFEAGRNRYFDGNSGSYAQAYALLPIVKRNATTIRAGGSAAVRNSDETRFALDAVSSTVTQNFFTYSYRGSYRGYWTPIDFREARAIVSAVRAVGNTELKAQIEGGVAHDEARAFGPFSGTSLLPSNIFAFDFHRTFHPYRLATGVSLPIATAYRLQVDVERSVTVFYAANAFRASLVRHR
jgi:tetratricopeptide (TPR) repeat protein